MAHQHHTNVKYLFTTKDVVHVPFAMDLTTVSSGTAAYTAPTIEDVTAALSGATTTYSAIAAKGS